jgi:hypothetical protein
VTKATFPCLVPAFNAYPQVNASHQKISKKLIHRKTSCESLIGSLSASLPGVYEECESITFSVLMFSVSWVFSAREELPREPLL